MLMMVKRHTRRKLSTHMVLGANNIQHMLPQEPRMIDGQEVQTFQVTFMNGNVVEDIEVLEGIDNLVINKRT